MPEVLPNRLQNAFEGKNRLRWRDSEKDILPRFGNCPADIGLEDAYCFFKTSSGIPSSSILWICLQEVYIKTIQLEDIQTTTPSHEPEKVIPHDFIDLARRLEKHGFLENALDLIYDQVDNLFKSGDFPECDKILDDTDTDDFSIDILLGLLTTTSWAKSKLSARENFFVRVEQTLRARGELEKGLLDGLEG